MPFDSTHWSDDPVILMNDSITTVKLINAYYNIKKGWCQRSYTCGDRVCAVGALGIISDHYNEYFRHRHELFCLLTALGIRDHTSMRAVETYNDQPHRTQDDMLQLYKKAIMISREKFDAVR